MGVFLYVYLNTPRFVCTENKTNVLSTPVAMLGSWDKPKSSAMNSYLSQSYYTSNLFQAMKNRQKGNIFSHKGPYLEFCGV